MVVLCPASSSEVFPDWVHRKVIITILYQCILFSRIKLSIHRKDMIGEQYD